MFSFYPKDRLISRVLTADKPVAFVVGSALSKNSAGDGVPGIEGFIELARDEARFGPPTDPINFEACIKGKVGPDAYQAAMGWVLSSRGPEGIRRVVKNAVCKARKKGASPTPIGDGEPSDWNIPPAPANSQRLSGVTAAGTSVRS